MTVEFTGRFFKDLDKINQASVKKDISDIIQEVKTLPAYPKNI